MIEGSRARLVTALLDGAIDIAIVTGETHLPNATSMSLGSERILVVLPDGHRLAANEIVHWTDLKGEALLLSRRDPGHEIHDLVVAKDGGRSDCRRASQDLPGKPSRGRSARRRIDVDMKRLRRSCHTLNAAARR